jgi:hypothetical protein
VAVRVFLPAHVFDYFGFDPTQINQAKDLLTNKKQSATLKKDFYYPLQVQANDAVIIQCTCQG